MTTALLYTPKTARRGEVITLKAVIAHPMETGYRRDANGAVIGRDIIRRFSCSYDGVEVFLAEFSPAIAANPFISFTTLATVSGKLVFTWTDEAGKSWTEQATLTVAG